MAIVDYFLKLDGIQGESPDKTHKLEMEIESFSWGELNAGAAAQNSGMGAGKVQMQDFHFVMRVNKASPKLFLACANGDHIKSGILTCRKAGKDQQEYLKYTFTDLLISSFQIGGTEDQPVEQISFNYTQVQMDYKEQKADGTLSGAISAKYNVKTQSSA